MSSKLVLPTIAALPANASTRTRILTAGVEVLHSDGLASLTQQAVAEKAGVRQSHITYYFPTRLDLLQATAQFGAECMITPISDGAMRGSLSFDEFRELLLPDFPDRSWWRLMTALVNACSESTNIRNWIIQFDDQIRTRLKNGFHAFGIELSDFDTKLLHAAYIGAITLDMQELSDSSQAEARKLVGAAIDLVVAKAIDAKRTFTEHNKAARQSIAPPPPRPRLRADKKLLRAGTTIAKSKKK